MFGDRLRLLFGVYLSIYIYICVIQMNLDLKWPVVAGMIFETRVLRGSNVCIQHLAMLLIAVYMCLYRSMDIEENKMIYRGS